MSHYCTNHIFYPHRVNFVLLLSILFLTLLNSIITLMFHIFTGLERLTPLITTGGVDFRPCFDRISFHLSTFFDILPHGTPVGLTSRTAEFA